MVDYETTCNSFLRTFFLLLAIQVPSTLRIFIVGLRKQLRASRPLALMVCLLDK